MHTTNHYSILTGNSESKELTLREFRGLGSVRFFIDVPKDEKMYVKYVIAYSQNMSLESLEVHIHDEKDIEGGEWDHGKFGASQTQIIK